MVGSVNLFTPFYYNKCFDYKARSQVVRVPSRAILGLISERHRSYSIKQVFIFHYHIPFVLILLCCRYHRTCVFCLIIICHDIVLFRKEGLGSQCPSVKQAYSEWRLRALSKCPLCLWAV